jgi:SAM-dependent methyltransferase
MATYYPASYSPFAPDTADKGNVYAALRWAVRLPYRARYGPLAPPPPPSGSDKRLLDVGSGAGLSLEEMASLGWEPWGIEPNRELAQRTAERLGVPQSRVAAATVEEAEFPEASFDLVTMSHVLEHLYDPPHVLSKIHGWLRPGGTLRIWLPNFASLESRAFGRLWHGLDVPRHLYHFSPGTLRRMLDAEGFEVERAVPQWQGNMLTGSITYALDALRGRRRTYRESRALHFALLPFASALLAFGEGGCLDVTARRRGRDGSSAL